ncbi:hypothetical protein Acr_15g0005160 [Actinidia rufa]|uniref:DDE Tnp4 domain-containing protein n=1 Tax=Actinidia rufa TaxID=165716 RepID=A0A7J0FU04_9ERIC|nr:hypothetical protein Acr_15g0005160 [Actinidia rufa]
MLSYLTPVKVDESKLANSGNGMWKCTRPGHEYRENSPTSSKFKSKGGWQQKGTKWISGSTSCKTRWKIGKMGDWFVMECSDDEKDDIFENYLPKEMSRSLTSNGTKFVDEVLNGQNEHCLENFRMDKHDAKELFNHRHSQLHSATDHTFGALKARFPILIAAPPYPLPTQVKLVVAACAIHNYIRGEKPDDWIFRMYEQEAALQLEDRMPPLEIEQLPVVNADPQGLDIPVDSEQLEYTSQLRASIAAEIWNDYIRDFSAI